MKWMEMNEWNEWWRMKIENAKSRMHRIAWIESELLWLRWCFHWLWLLLKTKTHSPPKTQFWDLTICTVGSGQSGLTGVAKYLRLLLLLLLPWLLWNPVLLLRRLAVFALGLRVLAVALGGRGVGRFRPRLLLFTASQQALSKPWVNKFERGNWRNHFRIRNVEQIFWIVYNFVISTRKRWANFWCLDFFTNKIMFFRTKATKNITPWGP